MAWIETVFRNIQIAFVILVTKGADGNSFKTSYNDGRYLWKHRDNAWTPCTVSCGKGFSYPRIDCFDTAEEQLVEDSSCRYIKKPDIKRPCYNGDCPEAIDGFWFVSHWGACSVTCGRGIRSRIVACIKHDGSRVLEDKICDGATPAHQEVCQRQPCPSIAEWVAGEWNQCSVTCGSGRQTRDVHCLKINKTVDDVECWSRKPLSMQNCGNPCVQWVAGPWRTCKYKKKSEPCNQATERRCVLCVNTETMQAESTKYCPLAEKPTSERNCGRKACMKV